MNDESEMVLTHYKGASHITLVRTQYRVFIADTR